MSNAVEPLTPPPATQGTITALQARGHHVTVRRIRNGSLRYRLDTERERTARQLANRLDALYGTVPVVDRDGTVLANISKRATSIGAAQAADIARCEYSKRFGMWAWIKKES